MRQVTRENLVGEACEVDLIIENKMTRALLDTGSTVSTLALSFYKENFPQTEIRSFDGILELQGVDGNSLPYEGYIEAEIIVPGLQNDRVYPCLFLIVQDTNYHQSVPILLGTNILKTLLEDTKEIHGERYLQKANLHTPWFLAFQCLSKREKELRRNGYKLGIVKSAEEAKITIPPNSQKTVMGYVDKQMRYQESCAMLQASDESRIPKDLDIVPTIINYKYGRKDAVPVHICNITTSTVTISPREILCELQAVNIEDLSIGNSEINPRVDSFNIDIENVTATQYKEAKEFLTRNLDLFSWNSTDIGHVTSVEHSIELENDTPFKQRSRRIPPAMYQEVRDHLQQLLNAGIIRKSKSPFTSNVVLCRKKNNELRMCVDYRQLNSRTKKDAYALPIVEEILQNLSGNSFFTVLDAKSGYHQVNIKEEHKERTAFTVGPLGFYEYNRMPFGLSNSPATYQRLMEEILGDLHLNTCMIFLDDIIIFAKSYEEHMKRLEEVFNRLRTAGLKLSPKKCSFLMQRVKYVGHIVSKKGIETDPEKTERVRNWPTPKTPEDVRRFLGFIGYYRRFIKNFSKIAKPLTALMPIPNDKKKGKQSAQQKWKWGNTEEEAFKRLKDCLASPPILGFPDYSQPFEVHTDASLQGLGAVLYQNQNGTKRVISYASRSLSRAERNYPAHKMEFLALKWAITEKFKDYLYGNSFTVYTDNNPLTYVLTSAKLDATGHRWLAELSNFNFNIVYRPGKKNQDADGLSRMTNDTEVIGNDSVKAICHSMYFEGLICSISLNTKTLESDTSSSAVATVIDWKEKQDTDPILMEWKHHVQLGKKPKMHQLSFGQDSYALIKNFKRLYIEDGVLYRKTTVHGNEKRQLVLPKCYVNTVLEQLHNRFGHGGRERTMSLIRDRFYWNRMFSDTEDWIRNCQRCVCRKTSTNQRAPLIGIKTYYPLELVCMDFLTLEKSKGGFQHILVVTDHFTRLAHAIPTRNMTAKTTAEALYNNFITYYGIPSRIHSDQGANFESKIIKELCNITGMVKSRTTPYHAMGNGMTERFNRTLLDMLGTLEPHQKINWKSHVAPLVHAYNCTRHESTNESPYCLMFGREPRLPIDLAFGINVQEQKTLTKYMEDLRGRMKKAYELASTAAAQARDKQKDYYDLKARECNIREGDRVLVKIVSFEGKHKIADRWEEDVYIVQKQPNPTIPVYTVFKENGEGRKRTLHRNLLLPIGHLDGFRQRQSKYTTKEIPPAITPQNDQHQIREDESELSDESSESESEIDVPVQYAVTEEYTPHDVHVQDVTGEDQQRENVRDAQQADDTDNSFAEHQLPLAEEREETDAVNALSDEELEALEYENEERQERDVRRSTRTRKQPAWLRSGEYVNTIQQKQTKDLEWKQGEKLKYLQSMLLTGTCKGFENKIIETMLDIIKH